MGDYKNLRAWQLARDLAVLSKSVITRLPREERYALADQWRRAVYSVALNIAEGASRRGVKDFRKHLDIARASLHEIEAIVDLVLALERTAKKAPRRSEAAWPLRSVNHLRLAARGLRLAPVVSGN